MKQCEDRIVHNTLHYGTREHIHNTLAYALNDAQTVERPNYPQLVSVPAFALLGNLIIT